MKTRISIGQLFMVGFDGYHLSSSVKKLIKDFQIGGVILFRRNIQNPSQVYDLCREIQSLSKTIPMLISVDHEGGRVCRLPEPFTQFPDYRTLGHLRSYATTYAMAEIMGRELKAVGINMNLAPVLDVDSHPGNPVIGDRSFGNSPTRVSSLGLAVIAGLQDHGVIACGKHFPGHGDTSLDSHENLPTVSCDIQTLQERELKPFAHAFENRLASVMTAHVLYPALDSKNPATLTKKIITNLLRKKMRYEGLVLTDDLEMGAITNRWGVGEAAVKSLTAGVDLQLICHNLDRQAEALEAVFREFDSGKLPGAQIEQSVRRVLTVKEKFPIKQKPKLSSDIKKIVGCPAHQEFAARIT